MGDALLTCALYVALVWVVAKSLAYLDGMRALAFSRESVWGRLTASDRTPNVPGLVRVLFTTPAVVLLGATVIFVAASSERPVETGVLGVATAVCAAEALVIAVLRRLVIGDDDWRTPDVAIPQRYPIKDWAVAKDRTSGANKSVYFLVLVFIAVIAFAALYRALGVLDADHFAGADAGSLGTWLYFSATTLATVGFGDIHPETWEARLAVTTQIMCGPLLLSWLLTVFLSPAAPRLGGESSVGDSGHRKDPP